MKIPIANQLKKKQQIEIAGLQDEVIDMVYSVADDLILHGGTSIWRCYSGKRFSEDLDLYSPTFPEKSTRFEKTVKSHGLALTKIKDTGNVTFTDISNGNVSVRIEVNHINKIHRINTFYELVDGTLIDILSLSINQLILEKISAYNDRRFIRDLYDIFHLITLNQDVSAVKKDLQEFVLHINKPVDEGVLKSIVYSGLPPSYDRMVEQIWRVV